MDESGQRISLTMNWLLNVILLLWITITKLTVGLIDIQSIRDDLRGMNTFCERNTCSNNLNGADPYFGCHCDVNCARFGTCCLDSPYIQIPRPELKPTCRGTYNGRPYLMIDHCPTNDSIWEDLCRASPYDDGPQNDFLQIVPVTSLLTSYTYRNYFCFRCHEANDEFVHWKVKLVSYVYDGEIESMSSDEIHYDFEKQLFNLTFKDGSWHASFRNDLVSVSLWLSIVPPQEIMPFVRKCIGMGISECSSKWTDLEVSEKCQAYMGVREVRKPYQHSYFSKTFYSTTLYKNIHCALCNFEYINNITCEITSNFTVVDPTGKTFFTFSHLLDINNADGDKVGKIQKCDDDHIWDRFAGKCRKLTCAFPGYKIKNGKCQP